MQDIPESIFDSFISKMFYNCSNLISIDLSQMNLISL